MGLSVNTLPHAGAQYKAVTIDPTGISTLSTAATMVLMAPVYRSLFEVMREALLHYGIHPHSVVTAATNAPKYKLLADLDADGTVDDEIVDLGRSLSDIGNVATLKLADV